jgi:hypothetical protein
MFPDAEQLREDLIAHFSNLDFITERALREAG